MNQFFDQDIDAPESSTRQQSHVRTRVDDGTDNNEELAEVKTLHPNSNSNHVEDLMLRVRDLIDTARSMPMSSSVLVNREELMELIDDALALLPEELKRARWLLKEKEQFLSDAKREAKEITDQAANTAARMVEEREIVRQAESVAQKIIGKAEHNSRELQHEAEDYVDNKLKDFEETLKQTLQSVMNGRKRLQVQEVEEKDVSKESELDHNLYDFDEEL